MSFSIKQIFLGVGVTLLLFYIFFYNSKPAQYTKPITIVFLGDSLTAGYQLSKEDSYPSQLEILLKENGISKATIVNLGVSGDTVADGLVRMQSVIDAKPNIVIIALGANDALQRKDTLQMRQNLSSIVKELKRNNITVILAGIKTPLNVGGEYGNQFESVYTQIQKEYKLPYIKNLLSGVQFRPSLNLPDLLHPNKEGHKIIAKENVLPVLLEVIGELR